MRYSAPNEVPVAVPLVRLIAAKRLSRALGFRTVYLLSERSNPTGSHKDRAATAMVTHAVRRRFSCVTVGTCGHMGLAIAHAARDYRVRCVVYASSGISPALAAEIKRCGANLRVVQGSYEDAVSASREFANSNRLYFDANPGGCFGDLALQAYANMAEQIFRSSTMRFESVWVACGNGTTVAGLRRGFTRCGVNPRLGAVGSLGNSALARSFSLGHLTEIDSKGLCETTVNRPLVNWSALDGAEALAAVVDSNGWILEVSDLELRARAALLKRSEGLITHPSSAAAVAGVAARRAELDRSAAQLVILTT